ncbi:hypothetical protein BD779DRAFT_1527240 [Infundibulicybe gibba]|nr:hypothetical protein BD779DRAFT_1527240 [Infundibulicybe gibba]
MSASPGAAFVPEAYLKTSSVAICLGTMLERSSKMDAAYNVYAEARMRVAAIAYRLGKLAQVLRKPAEAEEKWLTMAAERILQVISGPRPDYESPDAQAVILELDLPTWVAKVEAALPLEALGTFYADTGKPDLAIPLYLHAITILIPPPPQVSSMEDRCRGASSLHTSTHSDGLFYIRRAGHGQPVEADHAVGADSALPGRGMGGAGP